MSGCAGQFAKHHVPRSSQRVTRALARAWRATRVINADNDSMNCLRRLEAEAVGQVFVRGGVRGLGLIYEGLAQTFLQHATPIKLLAPELSSLTTSAVVATISRNTRSQSQKVKRKRRSSLPTPDAG